MHLGKFVHTETGKYVMSALLGFGLASLFRKVCNNKECLRFHSPPLEKIKDKIYKSGNSGNKCVSYVPVPSKCSLQAKIVSFE